MHGIHLSVSVGVPQSRASMKLKSPVPLKLGLGGSSGRGPPTASSGLLSPKGFANTAEDGAVIFDYSVFVVSWQDTIKMKRYVECEDYCRENIQLLYRAEHSINANQELDAGSKAALCKETLEYRSKVHFSLGYLYKKYMRRMEEARRQYELSVSCDSQNPSAHFNLANLLVDEFGDTGLHSTEHFEAAIVIEPSYTLYRMVFAEWLWKDCERPEEARKQYEAMLVYPEANHTNDGHFNYGLLLREHFRDPWKALEHFEEALRIDPTDTEAETELLDTQRLRDRMQAEGLTKAGDESLPPVTAMTNGSIVADFDTDDSSNEAMADALDGDEEEDEDEREKLAMASKKPRGSTLLTEVLDVESRQESSSDSTEESESEEAMLGPTPEKLARFKKGKGKGKGAHARGTSFRGSIHELGFVEESPDLAAFEGMQEENARLSSEIASMKQQTTSLRVVLTETKRILSKLTDSHREALRQYVSEGQSLVAANPDKVHKLLAVLFDIHSSIPEFKTVWAFDS